MGNLQIGLLIFPNLTQLDATGPFEVFSRLPHCKVHWIGETLEWLSADSGLQMKPTMTYEQCPQLDVVCVPGGRGVGQLMLDPKALTFLRDQSKLAKFVTSVCTGALVLGAAGLLQGYRATTHWLFLDFLRAFGAEPVEQRVVIDRNRVTGGGITAGIDFGLMLAEQLCGADAAREIQLYLEYDPAPPFQSGSPRSAEASTVAAVRATSRGVLEERGRIVEEAARRLHGTEES
jgi:cyclohexyl-isocyanide hydratase